MIEKNHNYFYKTINILNGKYYYGIRSCNKLPDFYIGSGTALKNAIKKYGKDNFIKEIIADYPTRKEASDHEARVVTCELIQLDECYNCRTGGDNEFTSLLTEDHKKKISQSIKGRKCSEETKLKIGKANKGKYCGELSPMYGKELTEEHKNKIGKASKGRKWSETTRQKQSEVQIGKKRTDIVKKKISEAGFKKCEINGVIYASQLEASKAFNIPHNTVTCRIRSSSVKWVNWKKYEDSKCLN